MAILKAKSAPKRRFKGDIFDAYLGICPECGGSDGWKNSRSASAHLGHIQQDGCTAPTGNDIRSAPFT